MATTTHDGLDPGVRLRLGCGEALDGQAAVTEVREPDAGSGRLRLAIEVPARLLVRLREQRQARRSGP